MTSQNDTSSMILSRIKLWPPQQHSSINDDDSRSSSTLNAGVGYFNSNASNNLNEDLSSQPSCALPSFGANSINANLALDSHINQKTAEESKDKAWFDRAYPFKADDFGQLVLPENVLHAKLVSLNNYGASLPMALITSNRSRHQPTESQTSGTFYLFTVDDNDYLTLYKIKSYLASPMSSTISNFKMAKKMDVLLEYPVQSIEWIAQESKLGTFSAGMSNPEINRRSKQLVLPNFLVTYAE